MPVNKVSPVILGLENFKGEKMNEAEVYLHLTDILEKEISTLLYKHTEAFETDKEPLGESIGHQIDIILNIERPYQPLLRRQAYTESPK
ncbi:hypothetical protein O181_057508 [Austropuccinia psidii MF-1]|uniref:Uncharacterized protein n=1 Tax=Austropuccinia psidii MF-1 TaxID=1389203 RepID=A0A9Q3HUK1_9BASI|nr:hypothetical protein [Austropuccinia psidii MF-1]